MIFWASLRIGVGTAMTISPPVSPCLTSIPSWVAHRKLTQPGVGTPQRRALCWWRKKQWRSGS